MRASELIAELQRAIELYGDLPVYSRCDYDFVSGVVDFDERPLLGDEADMDRICIA